MRRVSRLSLGVQKAADQVAVVRAQDFDALIESAGEDLSKLRAVEEMAEAVRRFSGTFDERHSARIAATAAKLKVARTGGRVLIHMAENGQRAGKGDRKSPALGDLGLTANRSSRWQAVARMTPASFDKRLSGVLSEAPEDELTENVARDGGSGDFEWFTPREYIEAARRVMGGIDLDPASSPAANEVVGAELFFTKADNGLEQNWAGRVWMNPPYAAKLVWAFCEKLAEDFASESVTQACVILNNTTETAWFQRLGEVASGLCLPARRVRFWHPEKPEADSPKQGQAVFYLGPNVRDFCVEFKAFGLTAAVL